MKSASYERCSGCGANCALLDKDPAQPCWGQVMAIDEIVTDEDDYYWIHACEGHAAVLSVSGGAYIPEGTIERSNDHAK